MTNFIIRLSINKQNNELYNCLQLSKELVQEIRTEFNLNEQNFTFHTIHFKDNYIWVFYYLNLHWNKRGSVKIVGTKLSELMMERLNLNEITMDYEH